MLAARLLDGNLVSESVCRRGDGAASLASMETRPATTLTDGRIVVRRYRPSDAAALKEAIDASVEHLRPWMPWAADEPQPLEVKQQLIARWDETWDASEEFIYAVLAADDGSVIIGGSGLHPRIGPGGMEIGYWVRPERARCGIATAAARLLTSAAFQLEGIDRVEIHHDRANVASTGVPRRLGFRFVEERAEQVDAPGKTGFEWVWQVDPASWVRADQAMAPA